MSNNTTARTGGSGESVGSTSRRSYLRIASATGLAGLAGCIGGITGGSSGPIKLGIAFPYTGPYSEEANTQKQGVQLAVQEINDNGGLLDRDVKVVERDTELDGDTSTRRIQDLIQNEDIDLLCANLSGGISIQGNVQAKQADIPYMAGCQTVPKFHSPDILGKGSFTPYALNVQSQRANMNFAYKNLGKSIFGCIADYAWGNSSWDFAKQSMQNLGGTVAGEVKAPLGNKDFSSQMTAAKDSGADILYLQNFGADQANSLKQAREFGLHEQMEIFVGVTTVSIARRAGRDQWDGIHGGIQYYHRADNPGTKQFSQAMNDKFNNPGDSYSAVTYTGVKEFERAIKGANSLKLDDMVNYWEQQSSSFQHVKSQEEWRACDNQAIQDWYIVKGKPKSDQENEWDLFQSLGGVGGSDLLLKCDDYKNY